MNGSEPLSQLKLIPYAEFLKQGRLVAFPTETVYGLGASAWNPEAVAQIFAVKGRPNDNPLIVHVNSIDMVKEFAETIPPRARLLMQKFWPGPLTLIFKKKAGVLDAITAGLETVAIRMPDHPTALSLIELTGALVAPSANKSGRPSPTKASHVTEDFGSSIPVIDGGECQLGLESTVLDITVNPPLILRPGYISAAQIHHHCGFIPQEHNESKSENATEAPKSPGMKYSHYAPKARVYWLYDVDMGDSSDRRGFFSAGKNDLIITHTPKGAENIKAGRKRIHYHGDYARMARELYDWFRKADHDNHTGIGIEAFPKDIESISSGEPAGALINRISKAAGVR
ncbi:MAG: threonylcarbamoyl-AMP synthase [Balneolales bacterium]|nr:threonylcarbamoyl-AMP synthase [Balneolales bacterium]